VGEIKEICLGERGEDVDWLRAVVKPACQFRGGCRCIVPPPAPLSHFVFNLQPRGAWGGFHGGASSRGAPAPAAPLLASPLVEREECVKGEFG
jgi:hypothetical protein